VSELERLDYLDVDDLLHIAAIVIGDVRVRDLGLLASAAARPRTLVLGAPAYSTLAEKAAALLHSLARNRALLDGNKRLAWSAMRMFCFVNNADVAYDIDDAEGMVVGAAAGTVDVPQIATWITDRLV